jgi:hypothetical protein
LAKRDGPDPQDITVGESRRRQFRSVDFGAVAEEEATFHGYTIRTRLRVGWHFVNGQFESDGDCFRVIIDDVVFGRGLHEVIERANIGPPACRLRVTRLHRP